MSPRQRAADTAARISPARAVSRWRGRPFARVDTPALERLRDHAASHGLTASREHYEFILADRSRAATGRPARIPRESARTQPRRPPRPTRTRSPR